MLGTGLKRVVCLLAIVGAASLGCTSNARGPVAASSATQPGYAVKYSASLESSSSSVTEGASNAKAATGNFQTRIGELKNVDWNLVTQIVDRADEAGKSSLYAEAYAEDAAMREFWKDEGDAIIGKVSGNAQYTAKQAGCTAEVGGAVSFAMKDSVTKALEKRLRSKNHAHNLIERNRTQLGQANATALEKLADDVALASYIVHVQMIEQRDRLAGKIAEKDTVKATLDRSIKEEQTYAGEAGRTEAEKKGADERIAAYTRAKGEVDQAVTKAQEALKAMDGQIESARKDYDQQLAALKNKIKERAASEPPKKT